MDYEPISELPPQVKQHMTRHKAPPGLERRVRHMIAQESGRPNWRARMKARIAAWWPIGLSFACGLLVASAVLMSAGLRQREDPLAQEVVAAHVRSLMADHLTDVASTDQHTVKPWFAGKLDFSPPVVDLAADGFPLVGGRLDYLADRTVAALVYRRRGHTINVFVMPAADARPMAVSAIDRNGFHVLEWQAQGMRLWAVSDVSPPELRQFVAAMSAAR